MAPHQCAAKSDSSADLLVALVVVRAHLMGVGNRRYQAAAAQQRIERGNPSESGMADQSHRLPTVEKVRAYSPCFSLSHRKHTTHHKSDVHITTVVYVLDWQRNALLKLVKEWSGKTYSVNSVSKTLEHAYILHNKSGQYFNCLLYTSPSPRD